MSNQLPIAEDARAMAAVKLIGRTGATGFQVRYSDDEQPVVWMALAEYEGDRWEVAAARDLASAIYRLCDRLIDGGWCVHCQRMSGFDEGFSDMPLAEAVCWYQYDPERKTFRRGCE